MHTRDACARGSSWTHHIPHDITSQLSPPARPSPSSTPQSVHPFFYPLLLGLVPTPPAPPPVLAARDTSFEQDGCRQDWCTAGSAEEGYSCWAGVPEVDAHARCTCSQGAARLTSRTHTEPESKRTYHEYTCCLSGHNVGELCGEVLDVFFRRSLRTSAANATGGNATESPSLPSRLPLAADPYQVTIVVSAGERPGEISWKYQCTSGQTIEGGAPYSGTVSLIPSFGGARASCDLTMHDAAADGWNGATWQIFTARGVLWGTQTMTEADGASVSYSAPVTFEVVFPSTPPSPPAAPQGPAQPPGGLRVLGSASLRAEIARGRPGETLILLLAEGVRYPLGGTQLLVSGEYNVSLLGEGREGATLDGEDMWPRIADHQASAVWFQG